MGSFAGRSFLELRGTLRYSAEVMRQVALLITGSALVLWAMQFTFGLTCGNESVYVLRGYGASSYAGVFSALSPIVFQIGELSRGAWESVHWAFTDAPSIFFSYFKTLVMWVAIVIAAMYYGFNAKGGPVGVGEATARSMVVALVLTMVLNEGFTFFFWGADAKLPVGG
ncbi:ABC transporter permease [Patulibacter sp. NPDC049589]|uniref:ABC transporter permease n=1 Tax=Patulibacter sp. NPDC049589 TaxID=3154731 RepID=UPI0034456679